MLSANFIKEALSHSCSKVFYQIGPCPQGSSKFPAHGKTHGSLSNQQLDTSSTVPCLQLHVETLQAVLDGALFQHLSRPDYLVLTGKPGSGYGSYKCQTLGICDILVPLPPDSGCHYQINQANPEITPASSLFQLNVLV